MDELKINEPAAEKTSEAPVSSDKSAEESYGKFKTKEGLLEAYGSLEAEFTRRSQKLKELESEIKKRDSEVMWVKKVKDFTDKYPIASSLADEITTYIEKNEGLIKDENCLEKALLSVLAEKNFTKPDHKESGKNISAEEADDSASDVLAPPVAPGGGEIPVVRPIRPKNIRDAGEMAIKILKQYSK